MGRFVSARHAFEGWDQSRTGQAEESVPIRGPSVRRGSGRWTAERELWPGAVYTSPARGRIENAWIRPVAQNQYPEQTVPVRKWYPGKHLRNPKFTRLKSWVDTLTLANCHKP